MSMTWVRSAVWVAEFVVADLAHELRRDYERGVFRRRTLGMIGGAVAVAIVAATHDEWPMVALGLLIAGMLTYTPARADRRWRDERRDP